MDMSAHPQLLEALKTTADPDKARDRIARGLQGEQMAAYEGSPTDVTESRESA